MSKQSVGGILLIVAILTIIFYTKDIIGIPPVKDWSIFSSEDDTTVSPVALDFEPKFINEGQHDNIPIKITIRDLDKYNITYLELSKDNIEIDRLNKSGQIAVASYINWKNNYNRDYLFLYNHNYGYSFQKELVAEGTLSGSGCPNCFMGESYPYQFTFAIKYKINDASIEYATISKIVPIID